MDPAKNLRNVSISLSNSLDESFVRFVVDLGRALKIPVMAGGVAVSYTHLTLPTNREV